MLNRFCWLLAVIACTCRLQAASETDDDVVRKLIATFSVARNAHDGETIAAMYAQDGEWLSGNAARAIRGRAALSKMWTEIKGGSVERDISSVDFPGPNIAVVHVATSYEDDPTGQHSEVFVLVKDGPAASWAIKIHQTLH